MSEASQRFFDDLEIGATYDFPSRTITDTHVQQFAALSGDSHPLHLDEEYAKQTDFGGRVAHGMMVATFTVLGASNMPEEERNSIIAFLEQSCTFKHPLFIGDTIYPELELVGKEPTSDAGVVTFASTVRNQDDTELLEGELRYLVERR